VSKLDEIAAELVEACRRRNNCLTEMEAASKEYYRLWRLCNEADNLMSNLREKLTLEALKGVGFAGTGRVMLDTNVPRPDLALDSNRMRDPDSWGK
jgi:hypothetical protein